MPAMQLMDWDEHIMLISHTVNLFSDHILVIGNTGSNSTKEALHATLQGFAVGMHASLQINPYYGKTSMPGEPCLHRPWCDSTSCPMLAWQLSMHAVIISSMRQCGASEWLCRSCEALFFSTR